MKYLKTFESSNDELQILPPEMVNDLHDICLELTDSGLNVEIKNSCGLDKQTFLYITRNFIYTEEISEVIERIKDYVGNKGYYTAIRSVCNKNGLKIDKTYDSIYIFFYKDNLTQEKFGRLKPISFKSSETSPLSDDILQDLKDILLELTDVGFRIDINNNYPYPHKDILVFKPKNELFKYKEVMDVVERIKYFMKDKGYSIEVEKTNKDDNPYIPNRDKGIKTLFISIEEMRKK